MELIINEITPSQGIYVKFRYTLAEDEKKEQVRYFNSFFEKATIMTIGYEELDKCGKPALPHIHYHMFIDDKIANIRGRLKTLMKTNGEERKGNALYSLTEEKDVLDINRFFRYVYKEGGRITVGEKIKLLKDFDPAVEVKCSVEERQRSIQFNNDKVERSLRLNTYDKIKELFVAKPPVDLAEVISRITDFYIEEGLACNASTMSGYATTYGLSVGLIDKRVFNLKIMSLCML